jgi:hypothetical protein
LWLLYILLLLLTTLKKPTTRLEMKNLQNYSKKKFTLFNNSYDIVAALFYTSSRSKVLSERFRQTMIYMVKLLSFEVMLMENLWRLRPFFHAVHTGIAGF